MRLIPQALFTVAMACVLIAGTTPGNATPQSKKSPSKKAIDKNAKKAAPKKIAEQLKPWIEVLKEGTEPEVAKRPVGYVRRRYVSSDVKQTATESDFADKPYVAHIRWASKVQESKIFADQEKASAANDWLPPGRVAGSDYVRTVSQHFHATLFFSEGKWVLDKLEWSNDPPARPETQSTALGAKHPWWDQFRAVEKK